MASPLKFFQLDVFARQPFCGNPLAVFPWADGLSGETMQQIAREMNLSETTFILPPEGSGHDFRVRIFTPGREIPFGGHPTLGTAQTLKHTGQIAETATNVVLGMGVGPVPVEWAAGAGFMTQPQPVFTSPIPDRAPVAQALGLPVADLHPDFPVQQVSTGFPALLVPLCGAEALQKIGLNLEKLRQVLGGLDLIYPFCVDTSEPEPQIRARSFAPFIGIPEDPATGSVAGALGAYLVEHRVFPASGNTTSIRIVQGVEMERPSEISVEIAANEGAIDSVRVGGDSCVVLEGQLFI